MIDNNKDQMSVNILPFSLDRIVRRLEDQFVDDLFQSSSSTGSTNQDQEPVCQTSHGGHQPG